jgi:hypothetical protein
LQGQTQEQQRPQQQLQPSVHHYRHHKQKHKVSTARGCLLIIGSMLLHSFGCARIQGITYRLLHRGGPGSSPGHVGFMADKVVRGQAFS